MGGRLLSDVFESFSVGVLVAGSDGRLLAWNPAVSRVVGSAVDTATTCCELFGCRRPGTPLAETCLTELALAQGANLPEVVLDIPGRVGTRLSVTTTSFGGPSGRTVLFELRRARADASVTTVPKQDGKLFIQTLGETVVRTQNTEIRGGWLDQRPGRLLKLLVAHRYTPIHGDVIAETLWPKARNESTNTVRHFVHALRDKLEPERGRYQPSSYVLSRNGGYMLNPERVTVDADEFEAEVKAGLQAFGANDRSAAVEHLRKSLEHYRGDFLADERFEDWAIAGRERLRDVAGKPLRILAALSADPEESAAHLERLADMEPLDVEIHRELLRVWLTQGRRGRAIRHYRALQSRLMRELGERITFDLSDLMHASVLNEPATDSTSGLR